MLAIFNSPGGSLGRGLRSYSNGHFFTLLRWCLLTCLWAFSNLISATHAEDISPPSSQEKAVFSKSAEQAYTSAKIRFTADTNNPDAIWQFARACFDHAENTATDSQREIIAREGIAACKLLLERDSNSAPAHYYLFMNLGEVARTKTLGALGIIDQMEAEIKTVITLDPQFDFAGADRNLGFLYLEAPNWPLSIGNKSKARLHLQRAVKLFPDYPENQLNLIEAELRWGEKSAALSHLKKLDEIWPTQRAQLTGESWSSTWADWSQRRDALRKKANEPDHVNTNRHKGQ